MEIFKSSKRNNVMMRIAFPMMDASDVSLTAISIALFVCLENAPLVSLDTIWMIYESANPHVEI